MVSVKTGDDRAIILGALLWMADKLNSEERAKALALWAAKGKQAFEAERATGSIAISQQTLQDRARPMAGGTEIPHIAAPPAIAQYATQTRLIPHMVEHAPVDLRSAA